MQTLSQILSLVQNFANAEKKDRNPRNLYEPIEYILDLGGKKLRPALVLMSYNLFQEDISSALSAGFAIEVFHNFTLMHDDIMDKAPLRRGMPTVHERYNVNTAILSGDAMLILAYEYLMNVDVSAETKTKLIKVFNKCAIEVCEGQQLDVDFETRNNVTIEEYLYMIECKTSVLLAAALQIGAIIGGASNDDAMHLYEFGRNIGIAFQLQDDILDSFGDPEKFGKKVGGDIIQNKKTYLYLKSLEIAEQEDVSELRHLYNTLTTDENSKINAVKNIFLKSGVVEVANSLQNEYYETAMQHLEAVNVVAEKKLVLRTFSQDLLNRKV